MVKLTITKNDGNQRLDRFLKKYLKNASLSYIYKLIRKDAKVNGKRAKIDTILKEGDEIQLYIDQKQLEEYLRPKETMIAKKQFEIAYEDQNIIVVEKPFGLLIHGNSTEKKNTLANQVCGYLQQKGEFHPGREKVFVPSPVNRLDRNTTGLVLFGKNSQALQALNKMIRTKGQVRKQYLTIVGGELKEPLKLTDKMEKDSSVNRISVLPAESEYGKWMETMVYPIQAKNGYTLTEVELITGRTHQIRAHLEKAGFPVIGDVKYGNRQINDKMKRRFGLSTQLLHAYKLQFNDTQPGLEYLAGKEIIAKLPVKFQRIKKQLFD